MNEVKKPQGLEIQLDEQVAQGNYCNLALIAHSTSEFIIDFATMLPGLPKGNVRSRIILTPQNAKRLLGALADNVRKFKEKNGKIARKALLFLRTCGIIFI